LGEANESEKYIKVYLEELKHYNEQYILHFKNAKGEKL
jgi:hypothetical protein